MVYSRMDIKLDNERSDGRMIGWIIFLICSSMGFYFAIRDLFHIDDKTITLYLIQIYYIFTSYFSIAISLAGIYVELGG